MWSDYKCTNLIVLVPHFTEVETYNRKLLLRHEKEASEFHYKEAGPHPEVV